MNERWEGMDWGLTLHYYYYYYYYYYAMLCYVTVGLKWYLCMCSCDH